MTRRRIAFAGALLLATGVGAGCRGGDAGDADAAARRDFLAAGAAFTASEEAEAASKRPDADPTTLEFAIVRAEDAVALWRGAALTRADWPEARRNVERGLLRLRRLRDAQAEKNRKPDAKPGPTPDGRPVAPPDAKPPVVPPPPPPPPPPPDAADPKPDPTPLADAPDLSSDDLAGLADVLKAREREKLARRRADRRTGSADVEKDW